MTSPTFRLDGKVALITGGSKGLGRAMALAFAEAGADVVVASRKAEACEEVAAEVRALGRRGVAVGCPAFPRLQRTVNLKGPLRLSGVAAAHLPDGGSIINISSVASVRPSPHTVVYAAAKAGLNALTKAAAQELGPRGIRVNAIICGTFQTDSFARSMPSDEVARQLAARIPLGRIASADEIVGTALFLASDASSYMTGALLSLDGGVS